eukprot:TRINITY_DN30937_c0_g1_i1.p1 TRINITY_DN30937_c0_g1~~TRINITY_DN30937_c0_g1_i1.p1  ORF type:complete len:290 (+),score=35.39 TRINITY_DN30937_c0_g1_i1:105-872(+)
MHGSRLNLVRQNGASDAHAPPTADDMPRSWSEPSSGSDFRVFFRLSAMHSFMLLPTCSRDEFVEGFDGVREHAELEFRYCDRYDALSTRYAEVHWNIRDCQTSLCFWNRQSWAEEKALAQPLVMHPICAWGIIFELAKVYDPTFRNMTVKGPFRALGMTALNPVKLHRAYTTLRNEGEEKACSLVANMVDWEYRLGSHCRGARDRTTILSKEAGSGVCWNNLIDFRDLHCHYKNEIDLNDARMCEMKFHILGDPQ